jgi:hypothetical protein
MMLKGTGRRVSHIATDALAEQEGPPMLELVYLNLFDYLARPNAAETIPDDRAVAAAMAAADKAAAEQNVEKATAR